VVEIEGLRHSVEALAGHTEEMDAFLREIFVSARVEPITPDNADRVTELDRLAHGGGSGGEAVFGLAFSPDGTILASAWSHTVRLWDVATGDVLAVLDGDIGFVNSVAFSPDGTLLAAGGGRYAPVERGVQLWDVATGEPLLRLDAFDYTVFGVAFTPDSTTLAIASGEPWGAGPGSVQLWDVTAGELLAEFEQQSDFNPPMTITVYGLAVSPDGTHLATINGDGTVGLWNVCAGREEAILRGHTGWGNSVTFSPDSTLLASSAAGNFMDGLGDARLWDVATGEQLMVLEGHTGPVKSVAFSPDGRVVASGNSDGTVRLWDTRTGASLVVLDASTDVVSAVVFSPDGTLLATGSWGGAVRLWGVPPQPA
jgi:WD40 repeat protein